MIQITKAERMAILAAYPKLRVPRTTNGKYYLVEEEKYLRIVSKNPKTAKILSEIDRARERVDSYNYQ